MAKVTLFKYPCVQTKECKTTVPVAFRSINSTTFLNLPIQKQPFKRSLTSNVILQNFIDKINIESRDKGTLLGLQQNSAPQSAEATQIDTSTEQKTFTRLPGQNG